MICVGETDWNKKNCLLTPSRRQITEWCPLCFTLESSDGMSSSLFDKRSLTWHSGLITFFNPLNVCMDHFALFLTTSVPSQNLWIEIDLTYNLPKGTWITLQRLCYCPYHFLGLTVKLSIFGCTWRRCAWSNHIFAFLFN